MKPSRRTVLGIGATIVLTGIGAAALYLKPVELHTKFDEAIENAQSIRENTAQWVAETHRVRADPSANFDTLSGFVPRMLDLRQEFSQVMLDLTVMQGTRADARAYLAALDALGERIERFKTAYSASRNSERYLPLATNTLVEQLQQAGDRMLAREIADVTLALAEYAANPRPAQAEILMAQAQHLGTRGATHEDQVRSALGGYVAHARVVIAQRAQLKSHMDAITDNEIEERAEALRETLDEARTEHYAQNTLHTQIALACTAGVLAIWVIIAVVHRRSAKARSTSPRTQAKAESESPIQHRRGDTTPTTGSRTGPRNTVDAMIRCGALPGVMGRSLAEPARRLLEDLETARTAGVESNHAQWKRMERDASVLVFLAERLSVLGRHLAPKRLSNVDLNRVLDERLSACPIVAVRERSGTGQIEAPLAEVELLADATIEWAQHCLQELAEHDAQFAVSTGLTRAVSNSASCTTAEHSSRNAKAAPSSPSQRHPSRTKDWRCPSFGTWLSA